MPSSWPVMAAESELGMGRAGEGSMLKWMASSVVSVSVSWAELMARPSGAERWTRTSWKPSMGRRMSRSLRVSPGRSS